MEQYPVIGTAEERLARITELREEDITEIDNLARFSGYQQGLTRKSTSVSAAYLALATDFFVDVDASGGAVTVDLPASPIDGQLVSIANNSGSNNAVADGNGKNINGSATLSWNTQYQTYTFIYVKSAGEWRVV